MRAKRKVAVILCIMVVILVGCGKEQANNQKLTEDLEVTTESKTTEVTTESPADLSSEETPQIDTSITEINKLEDYISVVNNDVAATKQLLDDSKNEAIETLGNTYDSFDANYGNITDWYTLAKTEEEAFYRRLVEYTTTYYKLVAVKIETDEYDAWSTALSDGYDIWNEAMEGMYDNWNASMEEIYDVWDERVSKEYDVDYSKAYEQWSNCYSDYSDTWSELYSLYLDNWSELYNDYLDVYQGFLTGNTDVDAMIKDNEEKQTDKPNETSATKEEEHSGNVSPDFKKTMDEYEAFFDSYVDFMKSYDINDPTMMTKYADFMSKYATTMSDLEKIDEESLSTADYAYYAEVMARINSKLLTVTY